MTFWKPSLRFIVCLTAVILSLSKDGLAATVTPALVPAPTSLHACVSDRTLDRPLRFPRNVDPGGFDLVRERWRALGIPVPVIAARPDVTFAHHAGPHESYTLDTSGADLRIASAESDGAFDALATLAQLPVRRGSRFELPCVAIADAPALRWRVVSDDISRGPFPTMGYFKERIRTLAGLKINGWSPYMENVFVDPAHPEVAFPNALTAEQLHALAIYARRYHITVIPEQQTFSHMHEVLKNERLAPLGEFAHGYLMRPDAASAAYAQPLIAAEANAAGHPPFVHVGADEPLDLGRGPTPRTPQVFAAYVKRLGAFVRASGARPMIWDDAIQQDPAILGLLPKSFVIVTFHYGAETSFAKYIATIVNAGFDQFVSPGANNWNEIYDDLSTAYANEAQFLADGKAAHVLGMFETVWHDDGESLFEATWAPVAFAAASAWQTQPVDRATWNATFARMYFGSDDPGFAADLDGLAAMRDALRTPPASDPPNYLFWADPFDQRISDRMRQIDLAALRVRAERIEAHLISAAPPLHAESAAVMRLAALRYDALGRRFEIGREARAAYADALAHVAAHDDSIVYRDLNVAKYLCWELRDELTAIEPLYVQAWLHESTPPGLARVLVRYRAGEARAMALADAINAATREDYLRARTLPSFETLLERVR